MENKYSFLNKIWIQSSKENTLIKVIQRIGVICLVIAGVGMFLTGSTIKGVLFVVLGPLFLCLRGNNLVSGTKYKPVGSEIIFEDKGLTIINYQVDREDKKGEHNEIYKIPYVKINSIEYSNSLQCIKIATDQLPLEIHWKNSNVSIDTHFNQVYLYLTNESKEDIYHALEIYTKRIISKVE